MTENDYPKIGRYTGSDPQLLADLQRWRSTGQRPPTIDGHLQRVFGAQYNRSMGILSDGQLYQAPGGGSWKTAGLRALSFFAPIAGTYLASQFDGKPTADPVSSPDVSGGSPSPGEYDFMGPSQTAGPGDPGFMGPSQGGTTGGGSDWQDWAKKNLNAAGATGKVAKAILAIGAAYVGHQVTGNGSDNVPPEITSMLKLSSDRANYQNPLFQAATQGTYQMLPTFARQGTTMPTGPLPDRRVP